MREKLHRALENIARDERNITGLGKETKTIARESPIQMGTLERKV